MVKEKEKQVVSTVRHEDTGTPCSTSMRYYEREKRFFSKATLPDSHTDFVGLLTDGCDTAVAPARFLVVTGRRSHVTEFTQF